MNFVRVFDNLIYRCEQYRIRKGLLCIHVTFQSVFVLVLVVFSALFKYISAFPTIGTFLHFLILYLTSAF